MPYASKKYQVSIRFLPYYILSILADEVDYDGYGTRTAVPNQVSYQPILWGLTYSRHAMLNLSATARLWLLRLLCYSLWKEGSNAEIFAPEAGYSYLQLSRWLS